jgi:hypothetical protein
MVKSGFLALCLMVLFAATSNARADWLAYDCADGYLIGINGMAHDWIDRAGAICSTYDAKTDTLVGYSDGPLWGSSHGGDIHRAICPQGSVVTGISYFINRHTPDTGQLVSQDVVLTCKALKAPHETMSQQPSIHTSGDHWDDDGPHNDSEFALFTKGACHDGQAARGFQTDSGTYIGNMGIICKDWLHPQLTFQQIAADKKLVIQQQQQEQSDVARMKFLRERRAAGLGTSTAPPPVGTVADFLGSWHVTNADGYNYDMTLSAEFGAVEGSFDLSRRDGLITNGQVSAGVLTFTFSLMGSIKGSGTANFHFTDATHLAGTWTVNGGGGGTWTAVRQ